MLTEIPSFEEYASTQIFSKLADIREFSLIVDVPHYDISANDTFSSTVIGSIYDHLHDVVKAAGFYYENELKPIRGSNYVGVTYEDDRYDFSVIWSEESIVIRRRGSRLSNFHDWYTNLMPSAHGIFTTISETVKNFSGGYKLNFLRVRYQFQFLLYDLCSESNNRSVKNSAIIQKLLKGFPDEQGRITEASDALKTMGRVDVAMSRWVGEAGKRRLVRFNIEAPANMSWSSLWFTFSYGGESYQSPDSNVREAFDPDELITKFDDPYVSFLRDSAINGFMDWLMHGYYFKTTANTLP